MNVSDKLGPYELVSPLGSGGMGEVWKARDTRLDRFVAIKTSKEAFNERFLQEARTIAKLDHPHICRLYDVGPDYLVMELLGGKPLSGPLPLREALTYAQQICSALHEAHSMGIVHRDLKPANIMVTRNGISLLDFGLAKTETFLTSGDETIIEKTRPGEILGTLHYMSPEQLQGKDVDSRSDIFSFGLVVYEMLTGKRAVTGEDPASVISQIVLGQTPQMDLPAGELPPALDALVHRCLEKKAEDRWQSARDLQWVLESIQSAPEPVETAAAPGKKASKTSTAAVGLVAALALLLGAAGAWWWFRNQPPEIPEWRVHPLTAYAGLESMPALSPDGKLVAFTWNGDQGTNLDIYVKQIGDETLPLRVTSDPAPDSSPAWSPSGDRLAFLRGTDDGVEVIIASSHGGGERTIASFQDDRGTDLESTLSWSPDGRFLALANGPILRLEIETREVKELTGPVPPSEYDAMPAYAPDGSAVAFVRGPYPASRRLYVQKLDGDGNPSGEPVAVSAVAQGLMGIAWWPDRKSLITSVGHPDSIMEAIRVPLSGEPAQFMPLDGTSVRYPSYAATQNRLVYQRRWLDLNILRGSLRSPNALPEQVVGSTHFDMALDVSPDGERIVFVSSRTGNMAIWRADRNGANQILLGFLDDGTVGSPRWTPDGKSIIFDGGRAGSSALYTVSSEGGTPQKIPGNCPCVRPSVSPDGQWAYYTNSSTGRREVYRMPIAGGEPTQITQEGGTDALPSSDGSTLIFYRDGEIRRVAATGGPESTVTSGIMRGKWTVAGDKVYAVRAGSDRSIVVEMEMDGSRERTVYEAPVPLIDASLVAALGVSARTGEIFFQHQARLESDLMIVEGFR